jgi:APA family basic amino acid/polyamine antiporter
VAVGEVIGVGIFLTPAEMAKGLGSPFLVLAVWLVMAATAICGALCYGELAARFPQSGGGYVYLREAWGRPFAFLYGWKCLLVLDPGLTAALAVGAATYASHLGPLETAEPKLLAIAAILLLAAVNALGVRAGAGVVGALTVGKILLLAVIVAWGFAAGRGETANLLPFFARHGTSAPLVAGLAGGLVAAFFSFAGFWDVAKLAGEVRDPARTLPRALALGVGVSTVIYLLTSVVFLYLVPIEAAADPDAFVALAGRALFGPAGERVLAAAVVVVVLGSLASFTLAAPRVYYAMARDGLFLRSVARLDPRHSAPRRAIVIQAALAALLVGLGTFDQIAAYFTFVTVAFVALTVAGIYRLPRPEPGGYRVPFYPWTPLAFLALLVAILAILAVGRPLQAAASTAVVMLGVLVYYLSASLRTHSPETREPKEQP